MCNFYSTFLVQLINNKYFRAVNSFLAIYIFKCMQVITKWHGIYSSSYEEQISKLMWISIISHIVDGADDINESTGYCTLQYITVGLNHPMIALWFFQQLTSYRHLGLLVTWDFEDNQSWFKWDKESEDKWNKLCSHFWRK